ncbi:dUTP diphosphatase [Alkaliphilus hydrothermalis]|uniref:Dimeric dUTPase (All-alpha-NTP-PPase superfamily) n=1 Tax=Alkaliphilus hydrothermalis TaxID=1482730 RepID=A0ABS2NPX6_9FIRM|nr:dUTP diphosphatase [Alkaliphilus hydrothermalis]MBM7614983.1 dimeric dUTPase (all-alpha-NTP-PPase superfamily) [Alkaliphilus hydrothermalis]
MNIQELFNIQKILDTKILQEHKLEGEDLVSRKIMALQVELGELANETRCFKYWSKKNPSGKQIILEEYVDCLHFVLSIGLEINFMEVSAEIKMEETTEVDQFLKVFANIADFQRDLSHEMYVTLWGNFILLGAIIGFSWEEINTAYLRKNEINHQRQVEGY